MKFVIHQMKIWFKRNDDPRILNFEPNKVNVITGDSGTGKTNILAIIDYCLLSAKINIVEQVINENSEWYSILISIDDTKYFLARQKEVLGQDSSSVCLIKGKKEPLYPKANININAARMELNNACGIINTQPLKQNNGDSFKTSFRTNLVFNYLTERVIALDNIYFDFDFFDKALYGSHEKYIIESAIGFDYNRLYKYEEELKKTKKDNGDYNKWLTNEIEYKKTLESLIERAVKNRLLDNSLLFDDIEEYQHVLQNMIDNYKNAAAVERITTDLTPLKDELISLKAEKNKIKKIENDYAIAEKNIFKFKDTLAPIKIIEQQSENIVRSYETQQLIDALSLSLQNLSKIDIKKSLRQIMPQIEKDKINNRIKEIENTLAKASPKAVNLRNRAGYAFIEASEINRQLIDLINKRSKLHSKLSVLPKDNFAQKCMAIADEIKKEEAGKYSILNSLNIAIQFFYDELKTETMGVYSKCEINFNLEYFIVQLKKKGTSHSFNKIGSKSNDMFLHLCCYLGIHKINFDMQDQQKILPFLFVDQPSIPYYSGSNNVENDDKAKLTDAFSLLNNFINHVNDNYKMDFQILLIEHAPKSYWNDAELSNFHTVEEFTDGNKLIPDRILNKK